MSTIFVKTTATNVQPRENATIRIRYYHLSNIANTEVYQVVQLLEFHPDYDNRVKCIRIANVRPELWMAHPAYQRAGVGYLEPSEQYVPIHESMIHEDDRRELMDFCARFQDHGSLIIHPCPRPYPMFTKGERVTVVGPDMWEKEEKIGARGAVAKDSGSGGTMVTFDTEEYNRGSDGQIHTALAMPSASLRLASDLVRSADYNSLVIAPLWRFYEAAKISLAELEAIPPDKTPVDWDYVRRQKQKMREEIRHFEASFPDYKGIEMADGPNDRRVPERNEAIGVEE